MPPNVKETHQCHPVLTVCSDDYAHQVEQREEDLLADDEWRQEARDRLELVKSLTDDEWRYLAELIGDYIWDNSFSETWQDALAYAADKLSEERATATR